MSGTASEPEQEPGTDGQAPGDAGGPAEREPGDRIPRRAGRLGAPPSQRYVEAARGEPGDQPSPPRGLALAILVAAFCGAILVIMGGAFGFTAGLIVVAFFLGRLTAFAMKSGAGGTMSETRLLATSVGISLVAVLAAQVGLWAWAMAEGGALGPVDFLAQTYGVLVLLELLLAGGAAFLAAS